MTGSLDKLQAVAEALGQQSQIVAAGATERNVPRGSEMHPGHIINIFAHPAEPIYTARGLNTILLGFAPEISRNFTAHYFDAETFLELGELGYDDHLPASLLGGMAAKEALQDGTPNRLIDRRVWLKLFPDQAHLTYAVSAHLRDPEGIDIKDVDYIPRSNLGKLSVRQDVYLIPLDELLQFSHPAEGSRP